MKTSTALDRQSREDEITAQLHKRATSQSQNKMSLSEQIGGALLNKMSNFKQNQVNESSETPYRDSSKIDAKFQNPTCFDQMIIERRNMGVARNLSFIKV